MPLVSPKSSRSLSMSGKPGSPRIPDADPALPGYPRSIHHNLSTVWRTAHKNTRYTGKNPHHSPSLRLPAYIPFVREQRSIVDTNAWLFAMPWPNVPHNDEPHSWQPPLHPVLPNALQQAVCHAVPDYPAALRKHKMRPCQYELFFAPQSFVSRIKYKKIRIYPNRIYTDFHFTNLRL